MHTPALRDRQDIVSRLVPVWYAAQPAPISPFQKASGKLQPLSMDYRNCPSQTPHGNREYSKQSSKWRNYMKTLLLRASLALGIALLAFSSSTLAWNKGCKNSTLEGDYAFTVSGTIFMPNNVTVTREGIALTHFDGKGNLDQVDYVIEQRCAAPGPVNNENGFHTDETG